MFLKKKFILIFYFLFFSAYLYSSDSLLISPKVGKIIDTYKNNNSKKTIIIIRDTFHDIAVQKNINFIIEQLKTYYKNNLTKMYVEGALETKKIPALEPHSGYNVATFVSLNLIEKGLLPGPLGYILINNDISLEGIEDQNLYKMNTTQLKMYYENDSWKQDVRDIKTWLKKEKRRRYPKEIKKIEELINNYHKKEINLLTLINKVRALKYSKQKEFNPLSIEDTEKFSSTYAELNTYIQKQNMEKLLDNTLIKAEVFDLEKKIRKYLNADEKNKLENFKNSICDKSYFLYLKKMLKNKRINTNNNYPHLELYLDYLSLKINDKKITKELSSFLYQSKVNLATNSLNKKILKMDRFTSYINLYLSNNMTSFEFQEFETNKDYVFKMIKNILREKNAARLQETIKAFSLFYKTVQKRNTHFLKTILYEKSPVKILVVGDFHADNIISSLRTAGVSYIDILPGSSGKGRKLSYKNLSLNPTIPFNKANNIAPEITINSTLKKHIASEIISELTKLYPDKYISSKNVNSSLAYIWQSLKNNTDADDLITLVLELLRDNYIGTYLKETYTNIQPLELTKKISQIIGFKETIQEKYLGVHNNNLYTAIKISKNMWHLFNNSKSKIINKIAAKSSKNIEWLGFGYVKVLKDNGWHLYDLQGKELFLEAGLNYINILGKTKKHVCVLDKGKRYIIIDNKRFSEVVYLRIYDQKTLELLRILGPYYNNDPSWLGEINGIGYFYVMKQGPSSSIRSYGAMKWGIYTTLGKKIYEDEAFNIKLLNFIKKNNDMLLEINLGDSWKIINSRAQVLRVGTYDKRAIGTLNNKWYFKKFERNICNLYIENKKIKLQKIKDVEDITWLGSLDKKGFLKIQKDNKYYIFNTSGQYIPLNKEGVQDIIWVGIIENLAYVRILRNNKWKTVNIK